VAGKAFPLKPQDVPPVSSKYRRIQTKLPVPESLPILETLRTCEPRSMGGQPPVVWDRAEGCQVYDRWGNMWLDWSSGVLVTSSGHGRSEVVDAVCAQARVPMLHNYCFPSELRARLAEKLVRMTPEKLSKVFLLTTGSEATECAFKLARAYGRSRGGDKKIGIVSFEGAFHGRTLGAQMMGGSPALKQWIVNLDPSMWQVPFPDGYWCEDTSFDLFLKALDQRGVTPDKVAGVITESYQGGGASFLPDAYAQQLARWCEEHDVVLIFDEIQAGFGRTGTRFGFEQYGIVPDIITCGKGISGSLPLAAVIGREDLLDQFPPGSMTSTHTGNPVCCAAALANLEIIERERLWEKAAQVGAVLLERLRALQGRYPEVIGSVQGRGLVAGVHVVKPGRKAPAPDLAFDIVARCVEKGLLLFGPVGRATVKICPPLVMSREQVEEGAAVLDEAMAEALK